MMGVPHGRAMSAWLHHKEQTEQIEAKARYAEARRNCIGSQTKLHLLSGPVRQCEYCGQTIATQGRCECCGAP